MRGSGREENRKVIETTGKSVEKALEKALKSLDAKVENVEIEILDAGQKGVLGIFGAKAARIRVTKKTDSKGVEEIANEVARYIMECLDINYRIFTESYDDATYVNLETAGVDGLLIGRKGDTLNSLQHLVGRIVSRKMGGYQRLTLDVGGYLKNRQDIIRQKAKKAAERARKSNREIQMEPMKASERRIVHVALTDEEGIITYTTGNGDMRKVCIAPAGKGRERRGGDRYRDRR
jgi:spoIIIJ-associated protein